MNFGYLVLLTNGVHSTTGSAAVADADYQTVRDQAISDIQSGATTPTCTPITNVTLNAICRLTFGHLRIGAATGLNPANVVVSFSFSTQSSADTLGFLAGQIAASTPSPPAVFSPPGTGPTGHLTTKDLLGAASGSPGIADIFWGRCASLLPLDTERGADCARHALLDGSGSLARSRYRPSEPKSHSLQSRAGENDRSRHTAVRHDAERARGVLPE